MPGSIATCGVILSTALLSDYAKQAETYDRTRGASRSILEPVRRALEDAPGRSLADVGGGSGNYAAALGGYGWEPIVIDRSPEMLALAEAKGLSVLRADAHALPLEDESVDAVTLISVLHHLDDPAIVMSEIRRILRRGGRLALVAFIREDVRDLWLLDYFPVSSSWMDETHPPLEEILGLLPGAVHTQLTLTDLEDASLAALASHPELILDPAWRRQTSYFERLARDHPDELAGGLERLRHDLAANRRPTRPGRGSLVAWEKPGRPDHAR